MRSQDFVGKEVDRECPEREDRRVERKAEADHQPIGRVESEDLVEFEFVCLPGLSKLVFSFSPSLEGPVDQRSYNCHHTCTNGDQQRTLPARLTRWSLRVERTASPRG